jgi:hypothetical protein
MDQPDIYTWATAGFERFTNVWEFDAPDDFWRRASTFEACVRFVTAAQAKWPTDPKVAAMKSFLAQMAKTNEAYFTSYLDKSMWADDYGWCGIASLAARDYLLSAGDPGSAESYLGIAEQSWNKMYTGYDKTDDARPVPHGCGNAGGGDPGTKNTVTNANLFVLSLRLYDALKESDKPLADPYLDMAFRQFVWFRSWFEPAYGYLRIIPGSGGLVQERPIAPPSYERKDRPQWEPGWTWAGDQGLVLGALSGLYGIKDDLGGVDRGELAAVQADVPAWVGTIAKGIGALLFGPADNVLREAPFDSAFVDDPKDYVCGRGVLLRYLAQPETRSLVGNAFDTGIVATAQAVWSSRDTKNQFGARWNPAGDQGFNDRFATLWGFGDAGVAWPYGPEPGPPVDGVLQAAGLDALGAALPILA